MYVVGENLPVRAHEALRRLQVESGASGYEASLAGQVRVEVCGRDQQRIQALGVS